MERRRVGAAVRAHRIRSHAFRQRGESVRGRGTSVVRDFSFDLAHHLCRRASKDDGDDHRHRCDSRDRVHDAAHRIAAREFRDHGIHRMRAVRSRVTLR